MFHTASFHSFLTPYRVLTSLFPLVSPLSTVTRLFSVSSFHASAPPRVSSADLPLSKTARKSSVGVPSPPPPPRRYIRPKFVPGVGVPSKQYREGPKELGYKLTQTFLGKVVSSSMQKTIAVEVSQYYKHPKYKKYVITSRRFLTHDENEEASVGDTVEIRVCRPLSKRKHFLLHKIHRKNGTIQEGHDVVQNIKLQVEAAFDNTQKTQNNSVQNSQKKKKKPLANTQQQQPQQASH